MLDDMTRQAPSHVSATLAPRSFDPEAGTIEVTWTTGADVPRVDYSTGRAFTERLAPEGADLARLNAGGPVLDTHASYSVRDQIGAVVPGSARVVNGRGIATLKLSDAPEHAGIVANIASGVLRNLSVGYTVAEWSTEVANDGAEIRTAIRT